MSGAEGRLRAVLEELLDRMDHPPERNCSCHLSPPCGDCVEYSGLRETIATAREILAHRIPPKPEISHAIFMGRNLAPVLRAMAANYARGHEWDHLDGLACEAAAKELDALQEEAKQHHLQALNNGSAANAARAELEAIRDHWPPGMDAVIAEVSRASRKFPTWPEDPLHAAAVVSEEAGELVRAVLHAVYDENDLQDAIEEAVQVGATALRFIAGANGYKVTRCRQIHMPWPPEQGEARHD